MTEIHAHAPLTPENGRNQPETTKNTLRLLPVNTFLHNCHFVFFSVEGDTGDFLPSNDPYKPREILIQKLIDACDEPLVGESSFCVFNL